MKIQQKTKRTLAIFVSVLLFALMFVCAYVYRDALYALITDEQARATFVTKLQGLGFRGVLIFLLLQLFQVLVPILPGEPFEIMAGVMFGVLGGTGVCLLGILLGSGMVYAFMKLLGVKNADPEALEKYRFLNNPKRVRTALFFLYFIPGTPKDVLNYAAPFLPVPAPVFFIISLTARLPSILVSVLAGANLAQGNMLLPIVLFAVTGILGIIGAINNDRIDAFFAKFAKQKP